MVSCLRAIALGVSYCGVAGVALWATPAYYVHIGGFAARLLTIRLFTLGGSCVSDKQRYCRQA